MFPLFNFYNESRSTLILIGCGFGVTAGLLIIAAQGYTRRSGSGAEQNRYPVSNAVYQQSVDHFSNDARAMSPRSWSDVSSEDSWNQSDNNSQALTSDQGNYQPTGSLDSSEPELVGGQSTFRSVEHSTARQPREFFRNQPLDPAVNSAAAGPLSSPIPGDFNRFQEEPTLPENAANSQAGDGDTGPADESGQTQNQNQATSRLEKYRGPVYSQGLSSEGRDLSHTPRSELLPYETHQSYLGQHPGWVPSGRCGDCGLPYSPQQAAQSMSDCGSSKCGCRGKLRQRRTGARPRGCTEQNIDRRAAAPGCGCGGASNGLGDPGWQTDDGTGCCGSGNCDSDRFIGSSDSKFAFEEDTQYPSAREILSQAVYFAEAEFMFLQPAFNGNTAIYSSSGGSGQSQPFNFDLEPAFRVLGGFESEYGPGFAGEYFQFDNNSDVASLTSDGITTGESRVYQLGPNRWTSLLADDPGESIDALHSLEVHSTSVFAFKALSFKRASVTGRFGLQIASIDHKFEADLRNGAGAIQGRLLANSEFDGFGPRFGIDYRRRIGHTPLQLISSTTASMLFGDRDQIVSNTWTGEFSSIGSDEFVTVIDIFLGVQAKRHLGEKRNVAARLGFVNQSWIGGGTAIEVDGDFGFQGVSMMLGFNR